MKLIGSFLLGLLLFTSCSKVADEIAELLPEKMSATIDGTEWTSLTRKTILKEDKFIITGISASGETIVVTIIGTATGTYNILDVPVGMAALYNDTDIADIDNPTNAYVGLTGTASLTEVNTSEKTISGTFSFTATKLTESVTIENGVFSDLKYTEN